MLIGKIIKYMVLFILLVFLIAAFLFRAPYVRELNYDNQVVTIERDQHGIPSLDAPDYRSMIYAWGYTMAEDRVFQFSFRKQLGRGQLSAILGVQTLNVDKFFRSMNFKNQANKTAQKLRQTNLTQYQNYQTFCRGVNDYIQSLYILPIEFQLLRMTWQPWKVQDIFLCFMLLKWSQSQGAYDQILRSSLLENFSIEEVKKIFPYTKQNWFNSDLEAVIVNNDELPQNTKNKINRTKFTATKIDEIVSKNMLQFSLTQASSNSFVISSELSQNGYPILANDPHLDSALPGEWHQIRIKYKNNGRQYSMIGVAMPGTPNIIGKNQKLMMGITTVYSDTQDLYLQTLKQRKYLYQGKYRDLKFRNQAIEIKGLGTLNFTVYETHRGPIINSIPFLGVMFSLNNSYSLAWSGMHTEPQILVQNSHFGEMLSFEKFTNYLQTHGNSGPQSNIIYASIDGQIGYQAIGAYPIRRNFQEGVFVKNGTTSENDWIGIVPNKDRLKSINPKKGYIVTANNKPAGKNYYEGIYQNSMYTARATRITQLIQEKVKNNKKLNSKDMMDIQLDTVDVWCKRNLPVLLENVKNIDKYLKGFDCNFTKQSWQASIYESFMYQFFKLKNPDKSGKFLVLQLAPFISYLNSQIIQNTEKNLQIFQKSLDLALLQLQLYFQTPDYKTYQWSKLHKDKYIHRPFGKSNYLQPLFEIQQDGQGNMNTPNVGKMLKISQGDFTINHKANFRSVMSFDQSYFIVDTGITEKFYSKYYSDQMSTFAEGKYLKMNITASSQDTSEL